MSLILWLIISVQSQQYYKCSTKTQKCWEINPKSEFDRFRRSIFNPNDDPHVCKMRCVCDPEVMVSSCDSTLSGYIKNNELIQLKLNKGSLLTLFNS